ncbi:hypothetical protein PPE03_12100 [Pseudoalteromonas peptidolytica]|nr:hypothetical protein PPE03_12100 [Pseudoalteromonas peptidolytica]
MSATKTFTLFFRPIKLAVVTAPSKVTTLMNRTLNIVGVVNMRMVCQSISTLTKPVKPTPKSSIRMRLINQTNTEVL